jgi:hypothetical protein
MLLKWISKDMIGARGWDLSDLKWGCVVGCCGGVNKTWGSAKVVDL